MDGTGTVTVNEFTVGVTGLLDHLDPHSAVLLADRDQLGVVADLLGVQNRIAGVLASVLQTVEATEAAMTAHGTSTVTWLAAELRYTRREASAMIHHATDLARFDQIHQGLLDGTVSAPQARAITATLRKLPADLGVVAEREAQATMVGFCDQYDSHALAGLSRHLLDVVAPEVAEEAEAVCMERELAATRRNRQLSFTDDGPGSTLIRGSLPAADAALLKEQIDAIAARTRRTAFELGDPFAEQLTPAMQRADALMEFARHIAACQVAPRHGGDRPHVLVIIDYQDLIDRCRRAGLVDGTVLTPGQLRRWACDSGIIPVILGGDSAPLDLGREQRLVTTDIRHALHARDQGCVFPGCNRVAADCDAHHIRPWQRGGTTSLANLVLLCPHHHNLCEPGDGPEDRRWQVRIGPDGIPEIIPPRFVDRHRQPRRHQRFKTPDG